MLIRFYICVIVISDLLFSAHKFSYLLQLPYLPVFLYFIITLPILFVSLELPKKDGFWCFYAGSQPRCCTVWCKYFAEMVSDEHLTPLALSSCGLRILHREFFSCPSFPPTLGSLVFVHLLFSRWIQKGSSPWVSVWLFFPHLIFPTAIYYVR